MTISSANSIMSSIDSSASLAGWRWLLVLPLVSVLTACGLYSDSAPPTDNPSTQLASADSECVAEGFAPGYADFPVSESGLNASQQWSAMLCALDQLDSVSSATAAQWQYVDLRADRHPVIGYKVALGSKAAQNLFGLSQPVIGALFADTLITIDFDSDGEGPSISRANAVNLAFEPDLLVTIKSDAINAARSVEDVAPYIESVSAFLEVPDLVVMPDVQRGPAFIASNAAVRLGVVGGTIAASAEPEFIQSLASMRVTAYDQQGIPLSTASGQAVMGHPYRAIVFLVEQLQLSGRKLQAGDVVSLGAFAPPKPAAGVEAVRVEYIGLGSTPLNVSARFID